MADEDRMDIDGMYSLTKNQINYQFVWLFFTNDYLEVVEDTKSETSTPHPPAKASTTSKQKFEVKKWTAVAFWSWGMYFNAFQWITYESYTNNV